ncbi:hypothetical protein EVJ50_03960 [Synechococcus sp. RSCCF101]|uniref:hypothetical protein n=1 Tax=Synechococcus sp. RSCCF101 TaxID=2511069 RepID=UPI001248FB50|nr:hypothetical protein [Synechococcus sp. RSCCF101]QEY31532.1 hypothetical protein EVJ50_03960 [Synechococcus sp. RSCCF101]
MAAALAVSLALPLPAHADTPSSAVVQEVLDGDELFIDARRAAVPDRAITPQAVRTGESRAQLGFDTGASGRLNRFSTIRLGSACFLLRQGQILVSGRQNGCVRSARLSVRGTNYVMGQADGAAAADGAEETEVLVLEGSVEVQPLRDGQPDGTPGTVLAEGTRSRLAPHGAVIASRRLTAAEIQEVLDGPLFDDFTTPLADEDELRRSIERNWPELPPPSSGVPAEALQPSRDPLVASINRVRADNGRPALLPLPAALAQTNITYLQPVLVGILRSNRCDHDEARWTAVQQFSASRYELMPTSEVIACPHPTGQWNTDRIVETWLPSPLHRSILLDRPNATHIGCLRADIGRRSAAMCTFWSARPR